MLLSTEIFSKRRKIYAIWRETWGDIDKFFQKTINGVEINQMKAKQFHSWAFSFIIFVKLPFLWFFSSQNILFKII